MEDKIKKDLTKQSALELVSTETKWVILFA